MLQILMTYEHTSNKQLGIAQRRKLEVSEEHQKKKLWIHNTTWKLKDLKKNKIETRLNQKKN